MSERRFTDREIGQILRRAVELEEGSPSKAVTSARGLTLSELQEIAKEAGIDPGMVGRAVAEMESRGGLEPWSIAGPSGVRRDVRTVPGEMPREKVGELMRVVDQEVEAQGTVVEALGGVRWTSNTRFVSTQVSVEPSGNDTLLRVEERYSEMIRGPLHGIPASWGMFLGLALGLEGLSLALPLVIILTAIMTLIGWSVGDLVWRGLSAGSRKRVRALTERLTTEASRLLPPSEGEEDWPKVARRGSLYLWCAAGLFALLAVLGSTGALTDIWLGAIYREIGPAKLTALQSNLPNITRGLWLTAVLAGLVAAGWHLRRRGVLPQAGWITALAVLSVLDLSYVELPVHLRFPLVGAGPVRLNLVLGPTIGINTGCEVSLDFAAPSDCADLVTGSFDAKKIEWAGVGGLGVSFSLGGIAYTGLDLKYSMGLSNVSEGSPLEMKNRTFSLSSHVGFGIF